MTNIPEETPGPRAARRRTRNRWLIVSVVVAPVLAAGGTVAVTHFASGASAATTPAPAPLPTTTVTRTDLSEQETDNGTLGYGAEFPVSGRKPGTVTSLPAVGAQLSRGQTVYTVDAVPVPLFYGVLPLYRPLSAGVNDGPDVAVLENNLKALGFDDFGQPDSKFTAATAKSVARWQKSLELPQTGTIGPADVVVESGPIRVAEVTARPGNPAAGDLVKATGVDRQVTMTLPANKQTIAQQGAKVGLSINGVSVTGTVTSIVTTPTSDGSGGGAGGGSGGNGPQITVTVAIDDQAAAKSLDGAPVSVVFTTGRKQGVLAVSVNALLALAGGGYGLQVVTGTQQHVVKVETGLFADGKVEVSGSGIADGTSVVTTG